MLLNAKDVDNPAGVYFPANAHEGSEKALDLLRHRDMLTIDDWSYSENAVYPDFDYFAAKGFDVFGSSWYRFDNIMGLSAYTQGRSDRICCTYWAIPFRNENRPWDPRGNRMLHTKFKTYKFLPAIGLGAQTAWDAGRRDLNFNFLAETLMLFDQRKGLNLDSARCTQVNLTACANVNLADDLSGDSIGILDSHQTLADFPSGQQVFGGVPFLIVSNARHQARAVSVKGPYSSSLPQTVNISLTPGAYSKLYFLHTAYYDQEDRSMHKDLKTHYLITYEDGSTCRIDLFNDDNIMAWSPALTRYHAENDSLWLARIGRTRENLPTAVYGYQWDNLKPGLAIASVQLQAESDTQAMVNLIALTGMR